MSSETRRILFITIVVFLLLALLGGFYLYLTGGTVAGVKKGPDQRTGIVPVMSIYKYGTIAMEKPTGIAADAQGNIYVTMRDGAPVLVYDRNGKFLRKWGTRGYNTGQLLSPEGIAVDSKAGRVYVADRGRLRLIAYDLFGQLQWETPILGALNPAVGPDGNIYVSTHGPVAVIDKEGRVVRQFSSRGSELGQFDFAHQLTVAPDNNSLFVADTNNARVQSVKPIGNGPLAPPIWHVGSPPRYQDDPSVHYGVPSGITQDSRGRLYVLDSFHYQIEVLDPKTGASIYKWTDLEGDFNGLFRFPTNIAYMGGDYFAISDTYNDRVQIIRLLPPGENNPIARNPWLLWLLPLLLIPLIAMLRRRRAHLTQETLDAAIDAQEFRLLAAAFKRLYILPELLESYKDLEEDGVKFGEYLLAAKVKEKKADKKAKAGKEAQGAEAEGAEPVAVETETNEERLVRAAGPTLLQKILFVKNPVVCVEDEQGARVEALGGNPVTLAEIEAEYELQS